MFSSFGWRIQMYSTHLEPTEGSWVRKKGGCTRLAAACGQQPDPHRRQEGLLRNLAVGQRLLQFGDARVGDLGAEEVELLQLGQTLQVHQSRVRDRGSF